MSRCKTCGAEIRWVQMAKTGKPMPLDAKPERRVIVVGRDEAGEELAALVDTFTSHFVTCPEAREHRRRRLE